MQNVLEKPKEKKQSEQVKKQITIHEDIKKDYPQGSLAYNLISECINKLK